MMAPADLIRTPSPNLGRTPSSQSRISQVPAAADMDDNGDFPPVSNSTLMSSSLTPQLSNVMPTQTSARSRTRSVGADAGPVSILRRAQDMSPVSGPSRGPGTPDFTLSTIDASSSTRGSSRHLNRNTLSPSTSDSGRKRSSSDASRISAIPVRPRLTSQLRSFISSFRTSSYGAAASVAEEAEDVGNGSDRKARSSNEYAMGVEVESLTCSNQTSDLSNRLVMPAARLAGLDSLTGFNSDSPPLSPVGEGMSDNSCDTRSLLSQHQDRVAAQSHNRDTVPLSASYEGYIRPASGGMTASSSASGHSSPVFSTFSAASSVSTFVSSHAGSGRVSLKLIATPENDLLPRHMRSPSNSPTPPMETTAAYWHAESQTLLSILSSRLSNIFALTKMPPLRPHLPALLFLLTAFIGSTLCVLLALSTLPLSLPAHITELTMSEIRDMSLHLKEYSQSSPKAFIHTLAVLASFYTWKQSFTVPGSIIMNVVFGAMYGTYMGTLYTSLLTSLGGVFCYLLMAPLASLLSALPGLSKGLEKMQKAMAPSNVQLSAPLRHPLRRHGRNMNRLPVVKTGVSHRSGLWSYLLVLRVLPIVPYGLMNIACSVLRVPLLPYAITLAIGSIPWNACTVQIGDLLVQVVSALDTTSTPSLLLDSDGGFHNVPAPGTGKLLGNKIQGTAQSGAQAIAAKIWNKEIVLKLVLMSVVSLAPLLLQRWLKARASGTASAGELQDVDEEWQEGTAAAWRQINAQSSLVDDAPVSLRTLIPARTDIKGVQDSYDQNDKRRLSGVALDSMCSEERTNLRQGQQIGYDLGDFQGRRLPQVKRAVVPVCVQ